MQDVGARSKQVSHTGASQQGVAVPCRLLYLFPHPVRDEEQNVNAGVSPTERLYGAHELRHRGWPIAFSDSRFKGRLGQALKWARQFGVILISPGTLRDIARCDIVIVKDDFSAAAALAARLMRKKLVFLDSMFMPPQRWWKTLGTWISLRLAHETICYSQTQRDLWVKRFGNAARRIRVLPYTIDVPFYARHATAPGASARRVLAVGRDVGRDYGTLIAALRGTDVQLDLITLPYLLKGLKLPADGQVTLHQRLSYEELFALYQQCSAVVVPLKPNVTYPSGIRALLEAMALRRPFVVTRNEVLEEYVVAGVHGAMVPAHDVNALRAALLATLDRTEAQAEQVDASFNLLLERYDATHFVDQFEAVLRALADLPQRAS